MMITERSKRVIPFRPHDAKRVGEGCFYLDLIVWLNGDRIEANRAQCAFTRAVDPAVPGHRPLGAAIVAAVPAAVAVWVFQPRAVR
jgi:hypothetical protein